MLVEQQLVKFMRAKRLQAPLLLAIPVASLTLQVRYRYSSYSYRPRGVCGNSTWNTGGCPSWVGVVRLIALLAPHSWSKLVRRSTGGCLAWTAVSPALAVVTRLDCASLQVPSLR